MILRRVVEHVKAQNWTAVALDFVIVVLGVVIGIQVSNWNEARAAADRRDQIVAALITDLRDGLETQARFVADIDKGVAEWTSSFEAGALPPPFYYRITGSDTPPITWETLQQMQLTDMFDPVTIFDLGFYYSELEGVGVKYVRYVAGVENDILPNLKRDPAVFYEADGSALLPEYAASMDRAADYARESERLRRWAACLIYRLEAERSFEKSCRRADFVLDGMRGPMEVAP